jgi:hypothetical protein
MVDGVGLSAFLKPIIQVPMEFANFFANQWKVFRSRSNGKRALFSLFVRDGFKRGLGHGQHLILSGPKCGTGKRMVVSRQVLLSPNEFPARFGFHDSQSHETFNRALRFGP